jgi:hypothetical protein
MSLNINIFDPDFVIDCSKMKQSIEIYDMLHSYNDPKMYCYAICYRKGLIIDFIKIGESAPSPGENTSEAIGERIKRQLEHVPGWEDPPHYSAHGTDFWMNVSREISVGTLPPLNKDNLIVGIWNLEAQSNSIDFLYESNKEVSLYAEGLLCEQYKKLHNGNLPILNIKDPTRNKAFKGPKLDKNLWEMS